MTPITRSDLVYFSRSKLTAAKAKGTIPTHVGLKCVDCGASADGYDHRDYRLPFDVEPCCHTCNARRGPGLPLPDDDEQLYEVDWYKNRPGRKRVWRRRTTL